MSDPTRSLFRASFKGIPFWVEQDGEEGGRRLAIHEFPMRDDPFIEDLGEAARQYDVTAYVIGDSASPEAAGLVAQLAARGPGLLVLPTYGPLMARCLTFKRDWSKDRLNFIAFNLRFVREGAASALASVLSLANLVFLAVDALASAASTRAVRALKVQRQPDHVAAAAVEEFRNVVSLVESVRLSASIDQATSASVRDEIDALYREAPVLISASNGAAADLGERVFSVVRRIGDAGDPNLLAATFGALADDTLPEAVPSGATANARQAQVNRASMLQIGRLAFLAAYAEAVTRATYPSRREGISARADLAERFEREFSQANGAENAELYLALQDLQGRTVEYLTRMIVDLAPIVTVQAARSMPSLYWAWRLYGDPLRATTLATRNKVRHPSFMPNTFEAVSR
ncbi:DNA circularization protein [Microvirga solisilvae]|uniref:DNA circularization protein n=1 Tax=Microvirga solisilvae TaxID=2919498 RepID=UPI001FAFDC64|nr:DNA circularization N-terminal domain-containing protein [Microvirga solisilvae]